MIRRSLLLLPVLLFACRNTDSTSKPAPTSSAPSGSSSSSTTTASSSAPTASASAAASNIKFKKYEDMNLRFTVDIPESYVVEEDAGCHTQTECSPMATFNSPDKEIVISISMATAASETIIGPPSKRLSDHLAFRKRMGDTPGDKKELPRGYWATSTTKEGKHYFAQEEMTKTGPLMWTLAAPVARKAEVEPIIGQISASLKIDTSGKTAPCQALKWENGDIQDSTAKFTGVLGEAEAANGKAEMEKFFTLALLPPDKGVCSNAKGEQPIRELHVYSQDNKADLKKHVGKRVTIEGGPFAMHTAHHHRPIVVDVAKVAPAPAK